MKTLRPYQEEDVVKLVQYATSANFSEQRTGKTPVALGTISRRNLTDHRVLIITTKSCLLQLSSEFQEWLQLPCPACIGTLKQKKQIINEWTHGLVITYDSLKSTTTREGLIDLILKMKPAMVILDEAHYIRNPKNFTSKAVMKLKSVPFRLAMTGTPAYGKNYDVFNILHWLYPNRFKSLYAFKEEYLQKEYETIFTRQGRKVVAKYGDYIPEKEKELQEFLNSIGVQRKRSDPDVMPWLPAKDYERIRLPMTPTLKKQLEDLTAVFETDTLVTKGVLDRLVRYRQLCVDPSLVNLPGASQKTEFIKDYIADYPDKPIIIFSNFTEYLYKLFDELSSVAMIVGDTPAEKREQYKNDFQAGKFNILLINIATGKEGLTLDRAETIIFTDKYPPIGDILQAEDRFIATTEEKANKPHTIIELVIADSFDEDIVTLLDSRQSETDVINNFTKYIKRKE